MFHSYYHALFFPVVSFVDIVITESSYHIIQSVLPKAELIVAGNLSQYQKDLRGLYGM